MKFTATQELDDLSCEDYWGNSAFCGTEAVSSTWISGKLLWGLVLKKGKQINNVEGLHFYVNLLWRVKTSWIITRKEIKLRNTALKKI